MGNGVTVTAMRDEALRLIGLQEWILEKIRDDRGLSFDDVAQGEGGEFGREDIANRLNALQENRRKLQDLEAVLAVVGTMKAGKSTTINAIVGREILPNRNRPMTSLPTLIRHVPGQHSPVMRLQNVRPLEDLVKQIKKALGKVSARARASIEADEPLRDLASDIAAGLQLRGDCEGEEGVYQLLAQLNDLVRLSAILGLEFPYGKYRSATDFPVIEVEFLSLGSGFDHATSGRFALLDTPGFNEAGHVERLLPLMQAQLQEASAVLAVLDYSQLKSTAEAELRAALQRIAPHAKGRMFAVVNKFDEKTANDDDENQTREFVSRTLLHGLVPSEHVYPVSAKLAFLAVRAATAWRTRGTLGWQAGDPESWVTVFAKEAWGLRWRDRIQRGDDVEASCQVLWRESLFAAPLTNAVQFAHRRAPEIAVAAAVSALQRGWEPLASMLKTRVQGFGADRAKVKKLVEEVGADIEDLRRLQRSSRDRSARAVARAEAAVEEETAAAAKEAKARVSAFLSDAGIPAPQLVREQLEAELGRFRAWRDWGSRDADGREDFLTAVAIRLASDFECSQELVAKLREEPSSLSQEKLRNFFERAKHRTEKGMLSNAVGATAAEEVLSFAPQIQYHSREEAIAALAQAGNRIAAVIQAASGRVRSVVREESRQLKQNMEEHVAILQAKAEDFGKQAAGAGFHALQAEVPARFTFTTSMDQEIDTDEVVQGRTSPRSFAREQSGALGWLKRKVDFFNQEWGIDRITVSETRYVIDKAELQKRWQGQVEETMQELSDVVQREFCIPARDLSEFFFQKVRRGLDRIERNLVKVQMDATNSGEEQERIHEQIGRLHEKADDACGDTLHLARDVKARLDEVAQTAGGAQ
jgi:GTPase SAR1 family protein